MSKILIEKETVELALEALEAKGDAWIVLERKAKAAIKEALAQSEQDLWAGATIDERWYITRQPKQKPVCINGLTDAETNATASVMGLVNTTPTI